MKKLDVSAVTKTIAMPIKSGTWDHLQAAYTEALAEVAKAIVGSGYVTNKAYILSGCINSGVHPNYDITAGAVFYNGEVYLVPAASFTVANPNVAVGVIDTSFFSAENADPVEFTDGVPRNVHQIRRVVVQSGLSGSGIANFLDWIDVTKRIHGGVGDIKMWNPSAVGLTLNEAFDTGTGLGIHPYTLGWAICDGQNGTVDMKGRLPVGYNAADADYQTPFVTTGGAKERTISETNLPSTVSAGITGVIVRLATADDIPTASETVLGTPPGSGVTEYGPDTQTCNIALGDGAALDIKNPYRAVLYVQRIF